MKRIQRFLNRPDVRLAPIQAIRRRLDWKIRWGICPQPIVIPFAKDLQICLPKTGNGALIYYQGFSEPKTADFVLRFLRAGMVFVDVGAHIGEYTLLSSSLVGDSGQVHSFEPQPSLFPILSQNIQMNAMANVNINQFAVSDHLGKLAFEIHDEPSISSIRKNSAKDKKTNIIEVSAISLDDYCSKISHQIDLIKIDVEGAELFVLKGAQKLLALNGAKAPVLIFEYAPKAYIDFGYHPQNLLELLERNGYEVYRYQGTGILDSFNSDHPSSGIANLIAVKDKENLLSQLNNNREIEIIPYLDELVAVL